MLIERLLLRENKRVALIVPKAASKPVWEAKIKKYVPDILNEFLPFRIINHSELTASSKEDLVANIKEHADVIIIDEAHHFRNLPTSRYKKLFDIAEGKQLFLLTATPINNTLLDLVHQIELFSRRKEGYFDELGIHSLRWHFINMERDLKRTISESEDTSDVNIDETEAREILSGDDLFNSIVVQRSRSYVQKSQKTEEKEVLFPKREHPKVVNYSLEKTYGKLLDDLKTAFDKKTPLLSLAIYYPLAYYIGPKTTIDPMKEGRQKQVVGLIRTLLLKRFESSRVAFEFSCEDLLLKLLGFVRKYAENYSKRWEAQHKKLLDYIRKDLEDRGKIEEVEDEEAEEDYLPTDLFGDVEELKEDEYDIAAIVQETVLDLDQLAVFIADLMAIKNREDDKLTNLVTILREDARLKENKVLIFSEYMTTAKYLKQELVSAGFKNVEEVDSSTKRDRGEIINAFSPYYNDLSSSELTEKGKEEIRILVSTDVLSEGLNLQDATLLINYDLHWNPVRLMQRIGRIDRRLDREIEDKISSDHPEQENVRGNVSYWNFLPPGELNALLSLYEKVTKKTLLISKTFGIEGKKLLTPEDDYDALKEFNHAYEGTPTLLEQMRLEYQALLKADETLSDRLQHLPLKIFSGKAHPTTDAKAVFFCYSFPGKDKQTGEWGEEAGFTRWYLYDINTEKILEEPTEILEYIRCSRDTAIKREVPKETLKEIRKKMDNHVKNSYLKSVQAPVGVKATLKAWMELT